MAHKQIQIKKMIDEQLKPRGLHNEKIFAAIQKVPREEFIPEDNRHLAYQDSPVPIGQGQTISQPYMVAFMTDALRIEPTDRILEIGTGCGYQTAILAELAHQVFTIERIESLYLQAGSTLGRLGYRNIQFRLDDGAKGWPEAAPFDKILCAAAAKELPPSWKEQLKPGGDIVLPLEYNEEQWIVRIHKDTDPKAREPINGKTIRNIYKEERFFPVRFVPLLPGALLTGESPLH